MPRAKVRGPCVGTGWLGVALWEMVTPPGSEEALTGRGLEPEQVEHAGGALLARAQPEVIRAI